jgi:heat shock protein HslJ
MAIYFRALLSAAFLLAFSACESTEPSAMEAGDASAPPALSGGFQWELIELNGGPVSPPENREVPHLVFLEGEQRVAGSTGCNRIMGAYSMDADGSLQFGNLATTMMACPDMETEAAFLAALRSIRSSTIQDGRLLLIDGQGDPVARFEAKPLPASP